MTAEQKTRLSEKLQSLFDRVTECKHEAIQARGVELGSSSIVDALAAIESLVWATCDVLERFPQEQFLSVTEFPLTVAKSGAN